MPDYSTKNIFHQVLLAAMALVIFTAKTLADPITKELSREKR
jgi:hypothetical protein